MTMDNRKEMHEKLMYQCMIKLIVECEVKPSGAILKSKAERRRLLKKRWMTSDLVKVRWHGVKREVRVCKECDSRELEDLCIWLLQCSALDHLRQSLLGAREDNSRKSNGERAVLVLANTCL